MKLWFIFLSTCCLLGKNDFLTPPDNTLTLRVNEIREAKGCLRIAIFNEKDGFLNTQKAIYLKVLEVTDTKVRELTIRNLQIGEYAIAIFHDTNDNGQLDTNWLGIPTEPYGFSNDAGKKWKKPAFDDAKVRLNSDQTIVELKLRSWKER